MSVSKNCSVSRKRAFSSSTMLYNSALTAKNSIDHSTCFEDNVPLPERKKSANDKIQFFSNKATNHQQQQVMTNPTITTTSIPHRTSSQRSVPAFLHKLFNMVNDDSNTHLIRWSEPGDSFLVQGHEEFAQSVLPRFYKHNTFASFVRQLNMYDFHKVPHLQQGVLVAADNTENEVWEFSHPQFKRGRPDLLTSVTRKRNRDRENAPDAKHVDLGSVVKDITAIRKYQTNITADLSNLHRDNELIWKETLAAREKHQKHQKIISKILQFLTVVFSNDQYQFNLNDEQETFFCSMDKEKDTTNKVGKLNNLNKDMTIDVPSVKTNTHVKLDTVILEEHGKFHLDSYNCKKSTCRSAQANTNDINKLQDNVETLAAQLGINSDIGSYPSSHNSMISSASQNDKLRLFKLANIDNNIAVSPPQIPSTQLARSSENNLSFQQDTHQTHKNSSTKTTASSSTSAESNNPLTFVLCQLLKTVDSYHTDPPFSCVRGTSPAHVNEPKDAVYQSGFIPCGTNSSDLTLETPTSSNELFFREVQKKRTVIKPSFHNTNSELERSGSSESSQHYNQFVINSDYVYNTITDNGLSQETNYGRSEHQVRLSRPFNPVMPNDQQIFYTQSANINNNSCSQQVGGNKTYSQQKMDSAMFMN